MAEPEMKPRSLIPEPESFINHQMSPEAVIKMVMVLLLLMMWWIVMQTW